MKSIRFAYKLYILLTGLIVITSLAASAANRYAVATNTWASTATWSATSGGASGASVPVAGDVVFIQGGFTVTIGANAACATVSIAAGSTLIVGGFNFTISGTTSVSGTITHNNTLGTKSYNGDVTVNSGGLWNETVAVPIAFSGGLTNNGTFTASTGVHTFSGIAAIMSGTNAIAIPSLNISGTTTNNGTLTVSTTLAGASTLTNGATGTIIFGGASITPTLIATAAGNIVNYNLAGAQTVKATTYSNLIVSGSGIKTATGVTVNGIMTMAGTASVSAVPTYGASATLTYDGSAAQLPGIEFPASFTGSGGVVSNNPLGITMNAIKTISKLTVNAGAVFNTGATSTWTLTVTGTTSVSGTLTLANNAIKTFTSDVTVNSGGVLTISSTAMIVNMDNLTVASGGTLNHNASYNAVSSNTTYLQVSGDLNINGTYNYLGFTPAIWMDSGGLTAAHTINTGTTTLFKLFLTYGNFSAIGTVSVNDEFYAMWNQVGGSFHTNGQTINANWGLVNNGGTIYVDGGSLTVGNSVGGMLIGRTNAQDADLQVSAGTLTITAGGIYLGTPSSTTPKGSCTQSGGTINTSLLDIGKNSSFTQTGGTNNVNGSVTLNYSTSTYTCSGSPTLTMLGDLSNSGTFTILASGAPVISVGGNLSNAAGASITNVAPSSPAFVITGNVSNAGTFSPASAATISVKGNWTNTGTSTATGGTVTFNGTGNQAIGGTSVTTFNNLVINPSAGITVSVTNNIQVLGNLTASTGIFSAGSSNITVGGNWTNNASTAGFTAGTGTVTFNGSIAQAIAGLFVTTFNNLTISNIGNTVTAGINISVSGNLSVSGGTLNLGSFTANRASAGGTLTVSNGTTLKIGGTTTLPSNYSVHAIGATSTIEYNGTNQVLAALNSAQNYANLTITGSGTKTLAASVNMTGTLILNGATITTGASTIYLSSSGTVNRTSGHVIGNFKKYIATGATSKTFEIGDAGNYTPATVAFGSVTTAGDLTTSVTVTDHPNLTGSGIRTDRSVNRYFTITNQATVFTTAILTMNWVAGDIDAGATTANFKVGNYNSTIWTLPSVASASATSIQATGLTAFGDFAIGELCGLSSSAFSYTGSPYCYGSGTATPAITGTAGTFTFTPAGLVMNTATGVVNLVTSTAGTYTVTNAAAGGCSFATAGITITTAPTTANAGPDQNGAATCGLTSVTLAANTPTVGTGAWSIISGTGGTVTTPGSTTSTFTGTAGTTYTLRWTISNSPCTASTDDVVISFNQNPTTANAGPDQSGATTCGSTTVTLAANTPTVGTGAWSMVSGTGGTITTPASATSTFIGTAGATYTLRWTISNNPCTASTDDVVITFNQTATVSGTSTASCVGGATGTITASASGGTTPYTYSLNAGAYQASATFTGLAAGTYTLNVKTNAGCIASTPVTVSDFATATDDQTVAGNNTWIGHMYDGTTFNNYIGQFTETENFNESFGGSAVCFNVVSNSVTRSIYTETYSVKFRMNSTKKGLYAADLGSDDGSRLTVDGTMVYNNWVDQVFTAKPAVLLNLNGASTLLYEFYESGGLNQVVFQNLTLVLANVLSTNTTQAICVGNTGLAISGDVYGTLPSGITVSGTGYQWSYSTTPGGVRTNIAGATGATFTPSAVAAPFNTAGTYYIYRTATLSSANNVSPNPYVTGIESNGAVITVSAPLSAAISYTGNPFCTTAGTIAVTRTGSAGGVYSSTTGLTLGANGDITTGTSTPGTYSVNYTLAASGGCSAVVASASVTITALPVATFSYTASPYCKSAANPSPVFTGGGVAGSFSSTTGLVFVSTSTGQIDVTASTAGTYTITNTIAASGGCAAVVATTSIIITAVPVATFSYAASQYCKSATNPSPTFSGGGVAGTFTSTTGLVFVSATTGQINLAASTAGTYTVTNTIAASGGCAAVTATSSVTITPAPSATISYTGSPYCSSAGTATVTLSGTTGGTYTSTTGLSINAVSGDINTGTSTAGSYTITYTIAASGGCAAVTATTSVTITALPAATFNYTASPYCKSAANPSPTFSGGGVAGTFTSTAGLVFVSAATGQIDLTNSAAGTYTITNTIIASGGCITVTATSSVTITAVPVATFSYTASPYCKNAANPSPTFTGGGVAGTFTSTTGLVFVTAATGQINLTASTAGTYTITNTIAASGGCASVIATATITITTLPIATFSYVASPYCKSAGNPSPAFSGGGVAGTFTSTTGLVFVSAATGQIDLTNSAAGTYTVTNTIAASGGCAAVTATTSVTITALPVATFSYTASPYCKSAANPSPTFSGGGAAGSFSSTTGLVFVSTSTGQIDVTASTAGTYTVTNTIAASGGCAAVVATTSITITAVPVATFSYAASPYCKSATNPSPTFNGGGAAGTFTSTAGLVFVSAATGQINLAASTAGTYTITNTIAASGGCAVVTATSSVTITTAPAATISYSGSPYCSSAGTATVTVSGTTGGTYSSTAGLILNAVSGDITLATSTAGIYTVTYTVAASGGCAAITATTSVTITALPIATFTYAASPYCKTAGNPSPTFSGGGVAGTFTSTAGLVFVSAATGQIDLTASTAGTYTVTNTIAAASGCTAVTATTSVTITALPVATFSYTASLIVKVRLTLPQYLPAAE